MTTKTKQERNGVAEHHGVAAKRVTVKGQRMVMLDEQEFERLLQKADEWEPALPDADADGNRPAIEACTVIMAQGILRDRRRLGLSQAELARRAGIRQGTLAGIEQATSDSSVATITKIDRALKQREKEIKGPQKGRV
jgi:DNA-binding XRE family transcriptional regulator